VHSGRRDGAYADKKNGEVKKNFATPGGKVRKESERRRRKARATKFSQREINRGTAEGGGKRSPKWSAGREELLLQERPGK